MRSVLQRITNVGREVVPLVVGIPTSHCETIGDWVDFLCILLVRATVVASNPMRFGGCFLGCLDRVVC